MNRIAMIIDAAAAAHGVRAFEVAALLDLHHGNLAAMEPSALRAAADTAAASVAKVHADYRESDIFNMTSETYEVIVAAREAKYNLDMIVAVYHDKCRERVRDRMILDPAFRERIGARRRVRAAARAERRDARLRMSSPMSA
jgi:hypothetical protein